MADAPRSGRPLDPETLAAYVDGRLPPDERTRIEAELASDPETYEWLVQTMHAEEHVDIKVPRVPEVPEVPEGLVPEVPMVPAAPKLADERASEGGPKVLRFRRRGVVAAAASALAVAAALLLVVRLQPSWWQAMWGPAVDPRFEKLVAAVGEERYIEGRLSGGFKYGPLRSVTRGPGDLSGQNLALVAAAGELQKAVRADSTAPNLHAWGVAQVLLGDLDAGIQALEDAAAAQTPTADLQTDLSAAYVARARNLGRADDWPRALASAERALAASPNREEALFNRALALEGLSLTKQAIAAWETYLQSASNSQWSADARARLEQLRARPDARIRFESLQRALASSDWKGAAESFAEAYPRAAREWVEQEGFGKWGEAILSGQERAADERLEKAAYIVSRMKASAIDVSQPEMLQELSGAQAANRTRFARAYWSLAAGSRLLEALQIQDALTRLNEALQNAAAGSALEVAGRLYRATALYQQRRLDDARSMFVSLAQTAAARNYLAFEARCHWMIGIVDGAQGRFSDSLSSYERARALYEKLGENDHVAAMQQLVADGLSTLGALDQAWHRIDATLRQLNSDWNPRRQYNSLRTAATLSRQMGLPEAVPSLQRAILDLTDVWDTPAARYQAELELARAELQLGRPDRAQQSLEAANQTLTRITDPSLRSTLDAQLLRAEALVNAHRNPDGALENLRRARRFYAAFGSNLQLVEIELQTVRALKAAGRTADAELAVDEGISTIESQRQSVDRPDLRISFLDRVWELFAEGIELRLRSGDSDGAFALAERGRARTTFEHPLVSGSAEVSIRNLQTRLTDDEVLVYVVAQTDRWFAWVVSRTESALVSGDKELLDGAVRRFQIAVRNGSTAARHNALSEISKLVWQPMQALVRGKRHLLFCPDGPLHQVPLAALQTSDGHFVVEQLSIAWIPAARVLLQTAGRHPIIGQANVFAPSVRDSRFPALPGASAESKTIAALYGVAPLTGASATRVAFLDALESSSVLHFAGHAVFDPQSPQASRLLLTAPEQGADNVTLDDLRGARILPGAVIVLAACSSGAPAVRRGEGALTLARPFLTGGARAVIATLWEIDDAALSGVFVELHEGLRRGLPPSEALAEAQRSAIRRDVESQNGGWGALVSVQRGPI